METIQAPPLFTPDSAAAAEPGIQLDVAVLVRSWWRIGVAAVVAGQSMAFSLAVNLTPPEGLAYWIVHGVLITAALLVCALLLPPLLREAWVELRTPRISVEFLFLITLVGAFGASITATLTRTGAVYYEVVSILLAVYAAGKTLAARSRAKALRSVDETREKFAHAMRTDGEVVAVAMLRMGDRVRVAPGGAIAVDGVVRTGRSFVQETAMTGEWRPLARGPGDVVYAGTHAVDGLLEIEVTAAAGERRIDTVLRTVTEARLAPSALQRQADRMTVVFLPLVLAMSAGTFGFWTWRDNWISGLFNSMAVLLVACPCALGLATPLAVWQGLARLASLGLVARTGDVLDVLALGDVVCFDKTGTLSEAQLAVREWRLEPGWGERSAWLKSAVAAVERDLPHPVARALGSSETLQEAASGVRLEAGFGVIGRIEGHEIQVGASAWLGAPEWGQGRFIAVAVDGKLAAIVELMEAWRTGAGAVVVELRELGVATEVLTGDTAWVGAEFPGAVVRTGLTPAEKLRRVEALRKAGLTVVFVGDGINDAAAMSAANTAIAMQGGAALAQASSPAVFLGGDLLFLPEAIRLARRVRSSVASNLRFAAAYNVLGMMLAAAGLLHPVAAALLMVGSSAFVSVRTLRTR